MGHANATNISTTVNRMLRAHENITIKQIVDDLESRKQSVHASEGRYTERYMLSYLVEEIVSWLREQNLVEPVKLTREQRKILRAWDKQDTMLWDCGDNGDGGEYTVFDSIQWHGLAKKYPILRDFTN